MTRHGGRPKWTRCAVAAALCLAVGAASAAERGSAPPRDRKEEQAARDAAEVARTIAASAKALSDFPKTRNKESVLSFYTKSYTVVENGEESSLEDQRQLLADLQSRLEQGEEIGISSRTWNIQVRVSGKIAWATYDYEFTIALGEEDSGADQGKCTSILVKSGSSWRVEHEHCSSQCPWDDEEDEEREGPDHEQT